MDKSRFADWYANTLHHSEGVVMWNVTIDKATGLLIESQSQGIEAAMRGNAERAGFTSVEYRQGVSDEEHEALLAARDAA